MNKVSADTVTELAAHEHGAALTIYMPTHSSPTPPNISENQIRYKNLIRKGFARLREQSDNRMLDKLEAELEQKADDMAFWRDMCHSLALFVNETGYRLYHLPVELTEQVYVGEAYDILPLLHIRAADQPFYLLALALHEPRLFRGDLYGLEEVAIELPSSPEEALNIDELFSNSNTIRAGSGSLHTNPHGQGDSSRAGEAERTMYWRIVEQTIATSKGIESRLPFILAGTEDDVADFRSIQTSRSIVEGHISGNRTKSDLGELHRLALDKLKETLLAEHTKQTIDEFGRSVGAKRADTDTAAIERAAREGRVEKLLLCILNRNHDSLGNKITDSFRIDIPEHQKDRMLAIIAAVRDAGGSIELFSPQAMPEPVPVAAVYRY